MSNLPEGFTLNYNTTDNRLKPSLQSDTGLPDGFELNYNNPSDVKSPKIRQAVAQSDPVLMEEGTNLMDYIDKKGEDFVFKMGEDYKTMNKDLNIVRESYNKGDITLAEAALRLYGDGANFLTDAVGNTVISALGSVGDGISLVTPDFIEDPIKDGVKTAFNTAINTDVGRAGITALMEGVESYKEWKTVNPRTAESLEAVFDLSIIAPTSQAKKMAKKSKIGELADKVKPKVSDKFKAKKPYFDMFDVDKTETLKKTRTNQDGLLKAKVVDLDKRQERAVEALRETQRVNPNKSVSHNVVKVNDELSINLNPKIAKEMDKGNSVNLTSFMDDLDNAKDTIYAKSVDKRKTAKAIDEVESRINEALKNNLNKDGTVSAKGMWEARKALDGWYDKFDKDITTGIGDVGEVVYGLRDTMNKAITDANPSLKPLFERQAGLLFARDGMAKNGAKETGHLMTRILQYAGVSRGVAIASVGLTGGAVGYMTVAAPVLAAAALGSGVYLGGRAVYRYGLSPNARSKHLKTVLGGLDKAYTSAKKVRNTELMRQIKTDRAAVLTYTKDAVDLWNNGGKEAFYEDNPDFKGER